MKNRNDNQQHTTLDRYRRQTKKQGRRLSALALVCIICCLVSGLTLAYLIANSDTIINKFTTADTSNTIVEEFNYNVKKDVKIKNTGDIDAYVRVAVVVTWQDKYGNVYNTAPVENTDYTIAWKYVETGNPWVKGDDGYYYYTEIVKPNGETKILFTDCEPAEGKSPDGYYLTVEILSQSIQAQPDTAVKEAWGVTISDNKVTKVQEGQS